MDKGHCNSCDSILPPYHIGCICPACQLDLLETSGNAFSMHYTIRDMMLLLGLTSEEQVRRLSREGKIPGRVPLVKEHLFFKEIVEEWIRRTGRIGGEPASPLQAEARRKCLDEDHGWLSDPRFDGAAHFSEEAYIDHAEYLIGTGHIRTCYFCGYSEFVPIG